MNENDINIINTSTHKNMTDNHLAQVNFTAYIPYKLYREYIDKTSYDKQSLGRIRFIQTVIAFDEGDGMLVFGRVSHGYGYGIEQDIFNSIMYSKGVK